MYVFGPEVHYSEPEYVPRSCHKRAAEGGCVVEISSVRLVLIVLAPFFKMLTFLHRICTGLPFPVPWYLIWANIYLTIRVVIARITNPLLKELTQYRQRCGIKGNIPSLFEGFGKVQVLVPSTPETDLPLVVPSHIIGCGPMLRPCAPVAKTHPELESWLSQGPTVLVNLGSHILFDEAFATEFATGLRVLLDRRPDIQVLWKLKTQGETRENLYAEDGGFQVIAKELASGRVRIEDWLPTEPIAILEGGHVICMVHHGGSNSYHEAIR